MATRMEKYYKASKGNSRSSRNKELYKKIYSYGEYSNIEGIASIDKNNEVDITKVKEMLDNREKYQATKRYRNLTRTESQEEELPVVRKRYTEDTERNYDIRDILSKARENKEPDDKERVLKNTNYDFLKNLDLKRANKNVSEEEELKDLINTITVTSLKNKEALEEDLFSDLRGDDTKVGEIKNLSELMGVEEAKSIKKEQTMDNSFFTSSLKLSKSDFVGNDEVKKGNGFKVLLIVILIIVIIVAIGILVAKNFMM